MARLVYEELENIFKLPYKPHPRWDEAVGSGRGTGQLSQVEASKSCLPNHRGIFKIGFHQNCGIHCDVVDIFVVIFYSNSLKCQAFPAAFFYFFSDEIKLQKF